MFKFIVIILSLLLDLKSSFTDVYVINAQFGLGNQMFMIAAQTAYAKHFGKDICLVNPFDEDFNVHYRLCTKEEFEKSRNQICYIMRYSDIFWKNEKCSTTDPLFSYFQNEHFFAPYVDQVREMFKFTKPLSKTAMETAEKIKNNNSVSIHIRRTDYIKQRYPIMSLQYYENGADYIQKHTNEPIHLFVFSDDIPWVKENFTSKYPFTIVQGNKDTVDMHLMSLCKHNIIANSSFSWWGAWLNENPNKIVVAPDIWLYEDERWGKDIRLKDWIILPSGAEPRKEE